MEFCQQTGGNFVFCGGSTSRLSICYKLHFLGDTTLFVCANLALACSSIDGRKKRLDCFCMRGELQCSSDAFCAKLWFCNLVSELAVKCTQVLLGFVAKS